MTETLREQIAQRVHERYGSLLGDGFPYDSLSQEQRAEYLKCAEGLLKLCVERIEQEKQTQIIIPSHSETEVCPHCGEEFGIESYIEEVRRCEKERTCDRLLKAFQSSEQPI